MTTPEPKTSPRRRPILIGLIAVAVIGIGVVLGLVIGGSGSGSTAGDTTLALDTTTTQPPPSTVAGPTTTTVPATTTSIPPTTTTAMADIGADLVITVSEDATVDSTEPVETLGDSDLLVANTRGAEIERALLRFEVEGIPEDSAVAQATIRFFVADEGGVPVIREVDGDWSEASVTWSNAPEVGDPVSAVPLGPEESYVRVDVTGAVQANGRVDFYLVNEGDSDFEVLSRESGDPPVLEIRFGAPGGLMVGAGDIASCVNQGGDVTADLIGQVLDGSDGGVVFTLGDNAYESGSADEFADCYDASWGRFKTVTRPSAGAREYRTPDASGYFSYFGAAAGNPGEGYYSYEHGGWHVVVLNSNCAAVGGCDLGSPQAMWLQQDLASSGAACTLAYWHHPLFGSTVGGTNTATVPFWDLLYEAGAEIVLNGDHHFYERFAAQDSQGRPDPEGLVQFTVGTGGRSLSPVGPAAPNSEVAQSDSYGVLALRLTPGGYEWEFLAESGSGFRDSGAGACH